MGSKLQPAEGGGFKKQTPDDMGKYTLQEKNRRKKGPAEYINPSVKALTVLVLVLLLAFQYNTTVNLTVFAACLVLIIFFSGQRKSGALKILLPALFAASGMFFMGLYYSRGASLIDELGTESGFAVSYAVRTAAAKNLGNALSLATRILAYAGLGGFFVLSTDPEEFIRSLIHQCRLPVKFAYGILAAFHMVPGIRLEYERIKLAFRTRGVRVRGISGRALFVLLVNCIRRSDNVAMAMESKGFSGDEERTYYRIPEVHARDILFFLVCTVMPAAALIMPCLKA